MLITTQNELNTLLSKASQAKAVAIDTEFVWMYTFYPRLGVIQLAIEEECFLIDPTEFSDLRALGELIANPNVTKILHDAQQDLTILQNACGHITPKNIFDTQLGYKFCSTVSSISLQKLLESTMSISLAKTETVTNWLKRPLSDKQIEYAKLDVKYLTKVMEIIKQKVEENNTSEWMNEEMKKYDSPELYTTIPVQKYYKKIKGYNRLNRQQLSALKDLTAWREESAATHNCTRNSILSNHVLLDIARHTPMAIEDLRRINDIKHSIVKRYGETILEVIKSAIDKPEDEYPKHARHTPLSSSQKSKLSRKFDAIKKYAEIRHIDYGVVTSKKTLQHFLFFNDNHDSPLEEGWRKEFLDNV
jgi:ribonuclease D